MNRMQRIGASVVGGTVALLGLSHPVYADPGGLPARVAQLERLVDELYSTIGDLRSTIACISTSSDHRNVFFEGCNVHVRNGLGGTDSVNTYGNLIIGYDEATTEGPGSIPFVCSNGAFHDFDSCTEAGGTWAQAQKTGSHNLVVGSGHSYTAAGGAVFGSGNAVNRFAATVSGGFFGIASGPGAIVGGGLRNHASGSFAHVGGGESNHAPGTLSSIGGGVGGQAIGAQSSISGGWNNITEAQYSSISGGRAGVAGAIGSTIGGGNMNRTIGGPDLAGSFASISGGIENETRGAYANVSGGYRNDADGPSSTVSGGSNRIAPGGLDWAAGSLLEDF